MVVTIAEESQSSKSVVDRHHNNSAIGSQLVAREFVGGALLEVTPVDVHHHREQLGHRAFYSWGEHVQKETVLVHQRSVLQSSHILDRLMTHGCLIFTFISIFNFL